MCVFTKGTVILAKRFRTQVRLPPSHSLELMKPSWHEQRNCVCAALYGQTKVLAGAEEDVLCLTDELLSAANFPPVVRCKWVKQCLSLQG